MYMQKTFKTQPFKINAIQDGCHKQQKNYNNLDNLTNIKVKVGEKQYILWVLLSAPWQQSCLSVGKMSSERWILRNPFKVMTWFASTFKYFWS